MPELSAAEDIVREQLRLMLSAALPLAIGLMHQRSGPKKADFELARDFGGVLAHKGDVLMFGGKQGEVADLVNRLVHALAVSAFLPGGVTFLGDHWEARWRHLR